MLAHSPQFAHLPDHFEKALRYQTIEEACSTAGYAQICDTLYLFPELTRLRNTILESRWVRCDLGIDEEYKVSVHLQNPRLSVLLSRMLREGDRLSICFDPRPTGHGRGGRLLSDEPGWPAIILPNTKNHDGNRWLLVQRGMQVTMLEPSTSTLAPCGGVTITPNLNTISANLATLMVPDTRSIDARDLYDNKAPSMQIYIRAEESVLTTETRLAALQRCLLNMSFSKGKNLNPDETIKVS